MLDLRSLLAVAVAIVACLSVRAAANWQQPEGQTAALEIQRILTRYAAALEELDADAVKKVQPTIDVDLLKKAFSDMRSLDVEIDDVRILSNDGTIARVSCKVTQTLTPKAGSKQNTSVNRVLRLRKMDGAWLIDGFER